MRIACISDTHGYKTPIAPADILIHAGDFSRGRGTERDFFKFLAWIRLIRGDFKEIVVIPGNHDIFISKNEESSRDLLRAHGVHLLIDETVKLFGMNIYGSPSTPAFGSGWAYNLSKPVSGSAWDKIPLDTDLLVTHGPPHNILDLCPDIFNVNNSVHVGCKVLAKRVELVKPKAHIFGHIHESRGRVLTKNTTYINAAVCGIPYTPVSGAQYLELK